MYPKSLAELIESFRKLPGVGEKTAERYALWATEMNEEVVNEFAKSLVNVKTKLHKCKICGNLSEDDVCEVCNDSSRNNKMILVVQSPKDVIAMERLEEFRGVYHVLGGLISSSKGVMPEDLSINSLIDRAKNADEVVLATNTTMDGETTAMYLNKLLQENCPDVLVTRIAHGLPSGGFLDYADEMTLAHALSGRNKM